MLPVAGSQCIISIFTSRKENGFYSKFLVIFHEFLKLAIAGPSSNSSIGMKTTTNCMDVRL